MRVGWGLGLGIRVRKDRTKTGSNFGRVVIMRQITVGVEEWIDGTA